MLQCDCFFQGLHLPVALCEKCAFNLTKQGATMKCLTLQKDTKSTCVQCGKGHAGAKAQLSYYEKRRAPF